MRRGGPLARRTPLARGKTSRARGPSLLRQADALMAERIRARDRRCVLAPHLEGRCWGRLDACHLVRRGHYATRWDDRNVHAGCRSHHEMIDADRAVLHRVAEAILGDVVWASVKHASRHADKESPRQALDRLRRGDPRPERRRDA